MFLGRLYQQALARQWGVYICGGAVAAYSLVSAPTQHEQATCTPDRWTRRHRLRIQST